MLLQKKVSYLKGVYIEVTYCGSFDSFSVPTQLIFDDFLIHISRFLYIHQKDESSLFLYYAFYFHTCANNNNADWSLSNSFGTDLTSLRLPMCSTS